MPPTAPKHHLAGKKPRTIRRISSHYVWLFAVIVGLPLTWSRHISSSRCKHVQQHVGEKVSIKHGRWMVAAAGAVLLLALSGPAQASFNLNSVSDVPQRVVPQGAQLLAGPMVSVSMHGGCGICKSVSHAAHQAAHVVSQGAKDAANGAKAVGKAASNVHVGSSGHGNGGRAGMAPDETGSGGGEGDAGTETAKVLMPPVWTNEQLQQAYERGNGPTIQERRDGQPSCGMRCPMAPDENPVVDAPEGKDLPRTPEPVAD